MFKILKKFLMIVIWFVFAIKAEDSDWDTRIVKTEKVSFQVETYADGFEIPWGMAFLPDNRMMVTDRIGDLWIIAVSYTHLTLPTSDLV